MIFDRHTIRRHKNRAACRFKDHSFLTDWTIKEMEDRLCSIKRAFPAALQIGADAQNSRMKINGNTFLVQMDLAENLLPARNALQADEEFLPFAESSLDLIFSPLSLHNVNDLPGTLVQIRKALKPDGLFLGAFFGGDTLHELRSALSEAELQIKGGLSPRVSPFADKRQMGDLMQRAGFALPVVDSEKLSVSYAHPLDLMKELRGMGESCAMSARPKHFTSRNLLDAANDIYVRKFSEKDGRIPASFEILFLTGWAPRESQQKPLPRGSAQHSLAEALNTEKP